jgi:hypothetical protein
LLPNPLPILLAPIGKGYEVPPKKGVTIVVILDIETAPHTRGQLIHETKGAPVSTTSQTIEDHLLEIEPQILPIPSLEPRGENPAPSPDYKLYFLLGRIEAVVDEISQPMAVDGEEFITWQEPSLLRRTPPSYRGDNPASI